MGSKAPLTLRPTSRHLSLASEYREPASSSQVPLRFGPAERGRFASEEPRHLLFYFSLLGCPGCAPNSTWARWDTHILEIAKGGLLCGFRCERSKQLVAAKSRKNEGTLLTGINLGVASGCNQ